MGDGWGRLAAPLLGVAGAAVAAVVALASPGIGPSGPAPGAGGHWRAGAELRRALAAERRGDTASALQALAALASRHPRIADYADRVRVRLLVEAGRSEEAAQLAEAWLESGSPLEAELLGALGDARAALGDHAAARRAFARALALEGAAERQAVLRLRIAASLDREGRAEEAAAAYLELWTAHPVGPEAESTEQRLAELERQLGRSPRGPSEWRRRGDALFRARRNEAALAAYEQVLALPSTAPPDLRHAGQQRAHALFRLRRYPEAAAAYQALPASDENRIARARAVARAGDVMAGAEALEAIGRRGRGRQAERARFLAALLYEGEGMHEHARELFSQLARRGRSSYAETARWQLGWAAYQHERYEEALEQLRNVSEREDDPIARLRARYWMARAAERLGHSDARDAFAQIGREYPLSYYGWRARARVGSAPAAARPDAAPRSLPRGRSRLVAADFERAGILLEAGLADEARRELDRLFARARSLEDRVALARYYAESGDFHRPQRLVVDAYTEPLARGPRPPELDLWWHAWPAPFEEAVRGATRDAAGVPPELVYAVMREESGYRPEVVSVSGARGLLQLMPETARRVARGFDIAELALDDLFLPDVNIRLGTAYLGQLLARFDGRASAAIASYNAGPEAVARWLRDGGSAGEDDEWVEAIPYDQTRGYVKRVLRSIHAYRVLY